MKSTGPFGEGPHRRSFVAIPHPARNGEEIRPGLHQRQAIFRSDPPDRHAGQLEQGLPPGENFGIGPMFHFLGRGGEESAECNVVGPGFPPFHREMAAVVAGNADLRLAPQHFAGFADIAISLPQMHTIRANPPGERNRVIDDEGHIARPAYGLQRLCKAHRLMLIDPFDAELKCGDGHFRPLGIDSPSEPVGEITAHVERRNQVELAIGHGASLYPRNGPPPSVLEPEPQIAHYAGMRLTYTVLAACAALAACATTPPPPHDGIARARLGERVYVDGPYVTPLTVLEDSRCPADVQCVWAGRLRITARVDLGAGSQVHELTLGQPLHIADGNLELVEAAPPRRIRKTEAAAPREDYRFGFRFMGGY